VCKSLSYAGQAPTGQRKEGNAKETTREKSKGKRHKRASQDENFAEEAQAKMKFLLKRQKAAVHVEPIANSFCMPLKFRRK
jgi:hypothetical protein